MRLWLAILGLAVVACAQPRPAGTAPLRTARIEGQVFSDFDNLPLRRTRIVLRPLEAGLTPIAVEGDEKGNFAIREIAAGRYTLSAQRDGFFKAPLACAEVCACRPRSTSGPGSD